MPTPIQFGVRGILAAACGKTGKIGTPIHPANVSTASLPQPRKEERVVDLLDRLQNVEEMQGCKVSAG